MKTEPIVPASLTWRPAGGVEGPGDAIDLGGRGDDVLALRPDVQVVAGIQPLCWSEHVK